MPRPWPPPQKGGGRGRGQPGEGALLIAEAGSELAEDMAESLGGDWRRRGWRRRGVQRPGAVLRPSRYWRTHRTSRPCAPPLQPSPGVRAAPPSPKASPDYPLLTGKLNPRCALTWSRKPRPRTRGGVGTQPPAPPGAPGPPRMPRRTRVRTGSGQGWRRPRFPPPVGALAPIVRHPHACMPRSPFPPLPPWPHRFCSGLGILGGN